MISIVIELGYWEAIGWLFVGTIVVGTTLAITVGGLR